MRETWLAYTLDISAPELSALGGDCLVLSLGLGVVSGVAWALRWRRVAVALGAGACVAGVVAVLAVTDALCVAGYLAADGSCAWE